MAASPPAAQELPHAGDELELVSASTPRGTSSRFTAWLSDEERAGIRAIAKTQGTSENYIVRLAIRAALGLSLPAWAAAAPPPSSDQPRGRIPA